jgi:hypothetical protein
MGLVFVFLLVKSVSCVVSHRVTIVSTSPTLLLLRTGIEVSPMCPLCDDAEEMNLGHIHKRHSLTGNMDNANNRDKWWNLSKLYWTARRKMGDIPLTGVGLKKTLLQSGKYMLSAQ